MLASICILFITTKPSLNKEDAEPRESMRLRSEIRSIGLDPRSVWETLVNLNTCRLITHDPMTPDRVQHGIDVDTNPARDSDGKSRRSWSTDEDHRL